ncbi:helix-turn-helix domain-containing protein [Iodobacter sp. LRB]|uniref:helix-turn-helix domain-containing protein n=1 Tax=unclassified Iodobacter TaxID=235634 RepID=UPI0015D51972|nr:helix-turn-helix domain-containing protein [Iodobacter sp. BJB302]
MAEPAGMHHLVSLAQGPQRDPLGRDGQLHVVESVDVCQQARSITAWQQLYDQLKPGQFHGYLAETWLDGMQCFEEHTSHALRQSCMVWPGSVWVGIPTSSEHFARIGTTSIEADTVAIRRGGVEFELGTPDDFQIMGLVLAQSELESYTTILQGESLPLDNTMVLHVGSERMRKFTHFMRAMLQVAGNGSGQLLEQVCRKQLRHELLDGFIGLIDDAKPNRQTIRRVDSAWQAVAKTREYVLDRAGEPISIVELCEYLGISRRTLQNIFHQTLDVCPLAYLKAIRLNAVRRELLAPYSQYDSVQQAAAAMGFWHMSQFSQDFKKLFGELPSAALARRAPLARCSSVSESHIESLIIKAPHR